MRKNTENILVFLLLMILPLIYIPNIFNPYEMPKFIFLLTIAILVSVITLVKNTIKGELTITKSNNFSVLIILYLLVVFVSDVLGLDSYTSIIGSRFRYQGLILLVANIILVLSLQKNTKKETKIYYLSIIISTFFLCFFSLWQAVSYYIFHDLNVSNYQGRIIATMGNPNFLAGYLVMLLPFSLFLADNKKFILKFSGWFLSLMTIMVILLTSSRGGILALGVILFIFGIWKLWNSKVFGKIFIIIFLIFILIVSLKFNEFGFININRDSIWDNRIYIWDQGIKAIAKRPVLGYGQENFELVYSKNRAMNVDNSHNVFLEIAVSSGLVGLIIFLAIYIYAFKNADFKIKLSLVAFLISAQFNPLSIAQIVFFWFLVGTSLNKNQL